MPLSEITHATVEQCDAALQELELEYNERLDLIRRELLDPVREKIKYLNREARITYNANRKVLQLYRDALATKGGPSDEVSI